MLYLIFSNANITIFFRSIFRLYRYTIIYCDPLTVNCADSRLTKS